jgi:hypothetical protein
MKQYLCICFMLTLIAPNTQAFIVQETPESLYNIRAIDYTLDHEENYTSAEDAEMEEERSMEVIRDSLPAKKRHRKLTRIN